MPFYLVGPNDAKIYNFRCHLCRNIGLKVFQLADSTPEGDLSAHKKGG